MRALAWCGGAIGTFSCLLGSGWIVRVWWVGGWIAAEGGGEILNPFDDAQDRLEFSMTVGAVGKLLLD